MKSVLADLLSGDSRRVLTSVSLINHTRDGALLDELAAALPEIRRATKDLYLGGMLHPNKNHVQQAMRVIENHRRGRCFCRVYPRYLFYDPTAEEKTGRVRITRSDPPDWNMTYGCVCALCGRGYSVQQGEYHYIWWEWRALKNADDG